MANKKVEWKKKHLALTVSLVGKMIEINRKGLLVLVFTCVFSWVPTFANAAAKAITWAYNAQTVTMLTTDTLTISWSGTHDVYYSTTGTCSGGTVKAASSSSGSYTTTSGQMDVGTHYFYCSIGSHCSSGMYVTVIATLETALAVTNIDDSNFHSAIATCLETNPVDGLCSSSEYGSMPDWDVSLVTDMSGWNGSAYQGFAKTTFNGDISNWKTEKVTNMRAMFAFASAFNQDIGGWNTERVTDMSEMFLAAKAFNHDISSWTGTAATTTQTSMFSDATAFQAKYTCGTNGPASSCDTIKSTWVAQSPPPSPSPSPSSPATALTGLLGLISASVVAFVLV